MNNLAQIHVSDVGTVFRFLFLDQDDQPVNLTGNIELSATFYSSTDEVSFVRNLVAISAPDGTASYTTAVGDFDTDGRWSVQGFVKFNAANYFHSNIHRFVIVDNLPVP